MSKSNKQSDGPDWHALLKGMAAAILGLAMGIALLIPTFAHAAEEERPNIIVLLTDDQRMDSLSCYDADCAIQTPHIDRLADEGVRFENGFVTTPICAASRACIITGRYASSNRMHDFGTPIPEDVFQDSYPARLKEAGYFVGALGKYGVGVNEIVRKTFDVFEAQASQGPRFREYQGKEMHDAEWLTVKTMEFLDVVPENTPFALHVNYKEPHGSATPAPEDKGRLDHYNFERAETDTPEAFAKLPALMEGSLGHLNYYYGGDDDAMNLRKRNYYEMILSVDRSVGEIVKGLKSRGLAENTVIIYLADHGLHLGEKQLGGKWTPYEESLRIPFIVYDPRNPARKGKVFKEMVLNIDVAPTVLELAGVDVPEGMDGRSLVSLLDGEERSWRKHFFFEHYCAPPHVSSFIPRNEGIRTETAKFIRWIDFGRVEEEYFDLVRDPLETQSLVGNSEYKPDIETLRREFAQWRAENPSNYEHVHNGIPHFGTMNIDWVKFEEASPEVYGRIKAAVESLGVTWEQAEEDWDIRRQVSKKAKWWY